MWARFQAKFLSKEAWAGRWEGLVRLIPFSWWGIRPASLVLLSGTASVPVRGRYPRDKSSKLVWGHSLDYDTYLELIDRPPEPAAGRPTAVYLDENLPYHPDFTHEGIRSPFPPEEYYPPLRDFFDLVEKRLNVQVVVAAHPRSDYKDNQCFGGRPLVKSRTAELVRQCRFAMTHSSTSINFAVLFDKPLLFLTMDTFEKDLVKQRRILSLARLFNRKPVHIDRPGRDEALEGITADPEAYARYREEYIKKTSSPQKPVWQIFVDAVRDMENSRP